MESAPESMGPPRAGVRPRVLMVLSSGTYPPDRRVEREAEALDEEGWDVHLLSRRGPEQAPHERVGVVSVERFDLPFARRPRLRDLWYYAFDRWWCAVRIARAARRLGASALHAHDLPYAAPTVLAGRWLGIPTVVDLHEHYTAMLAVGFEEPRYRRGRALARPLLAWLQREERWACRRADRVVVVTEEHVDRIRSLGTPSDRIAVVGNCEDPDVLRAQPVDRGVAERFAGEFVLVYAGMFDAHRELDVAIDAMPAILHREPNARLVLVGDGSLRVSLERRAAERGVAERVTFAGYQPFTALRSWLEAGHVGLVPHRRTELVDVTMPNKIFQLMALGRPLLVTDAPPLARVVERSGCGAVYRGGDAGDFARAALALRDARTRAAMGERGREAVAGRYGWRAESQSLRALYAGLHPGGATATAGPALACTSAIPRSG